MINIIRKNRFIFLVTAGICLLALLVLWFFQSNKPQASGTHQPWLASSFSLVLGSDDFSDSDLQAKYLENIEDENSVVLDPINLQSAQALLPFAGEVYIHLFNNINEVGEINATTSWTFSQPFKFATYINDNSFARIIYQPTEQKLSFVMTGSNLLINNEGFRVSDVVLKSIDNINNDSLIKFNDRLINLAKYQNNETIKVSDLQNLEITEYSSNKQNVLSAQNYSFEQGLWQAQVSDCSAYLPGEPNMGMSIESVATEGVLGLSLTSANHHACSSNNFNVSLNDNNLYLFLVDYMMRNGNVAQAYYNLKNDLGKNQEEFISITSENSQSWQVIEKIIHPTIVSPNSFDVYLYAPSDGSQTVDVLYDNIRLLEYQEKRRVVISEKFTGKKITDQNFNLDQVVNFGVNNSDTNLLENYNYSFEQGLWKPEVEDCSNYLKGEAQIAMKINSDFSHGSQSLELSSNNHHACTFNKFPVFLSADTLYAMVFDYKNVNGSAVRYYFNAPVKDINQEHFDNFDAEDNEWHSEYFNIDLKNADAKEFDFYLYAPSEGNKHIVNLFDNIRLLSKGMKNIFNYFLFSENNAVKLDTTATIEYKKINDYQASIILHNVNQPLVLVYPKNYSKQTSLYFLPVDTKPALTSPLSSAADYYFEKNDLTGTIDRKEVEELLASGFLSEIGNQEVRRLSGNTLYNNNLSKPSLSNWLFADKISNNYSAITHSNYHAWLINPVEFCATQKKNCAVNQDGSYDLVLLISNSYAKLIFWLRVLLVLGFIASVATYWFLGNKRND